MRRCFALSAIILPLLAVGAVAAQPQTVAPHEALNQALDEERRGIAYVQAMIDRFGEKMPLTVIIEYKKQAETALLSQYKRIERNAPGDRWKGSHFNIPDERSAAADIAEFIEVDTAALYLVLSQRVEQKGLKNLFVRLSAQSKSRQINYLKRISNGWRPLRAQDIDVDQDDQIENAQAATQAAFSRFMATLSEHLEAGTPEDAIEVCKDIAPRIAREVGAEYNVRLGRTSWALRNPNNVGPLWTEWLVDDMPMEPAHSADKIGRLGSVFPIFVNDACLTCHGSADQIPDAVREAIDELYMNDQAKGFKAGDLRGWFWVESPPVVPVQKN